MVVRVVEEAMRLESSLPALLSLALIAAPQATPIETAISLYDEGKYEEARPLLESIDHEGKATGPLLYRLFFCRSAAGDEAGSREALGRARERLEAELGSTPTLETYFYLANTFANLGRSSDARRTAIEGVAAIEAGRIESGVSPISRFQMAKLYQDAGRSEDAVRLFRLALEGFSASGRKYPGSERWARRYLATSSFSNADFTAAEADLAALVALGGATPEDWNRLAVARVRIGRYAEASDAWRESVRLDPGNADDPRYSGRLAQTASQIAPLPGVSPSGKSWQRLSQEELEALMKESAATVLEARERASTGERKAFEDAVSKARPVFVAAGLEYACRRLPIRETAFREGYAVLIFQDAPWSWPEGTQN